MDEDVVTCRRPEGTMDAVLTKPYSGEWTVDDLDAAPDHEGLQYELVDGVLLVTPSPAWIHQRLTTRLAALLAAACPPELEAFVAPLDFRPTSRRSLQPDLLVVNRAQLTATVPHIVQPPLLVVEVLSPSTRAKDLVLKRSLYAESGVAFYWIVDPEEPSIVVLELHGSEYDETARAVGAEVVAISRPFDVELNPAALLT